MKGFSPWPGKVRLITQNTELDTTKIIVHSLNIFQILEDYHYYYFILLRLPTLLKT